MTNFLVLCVIYMQSGIYFRCLSDKVALSDLGGRSLRTSLCKEFQQDAT